MFQGNDLNNAMGIPFFYGACEAFLVGIYCLGCWKAGWSKAPADESFWKVLFTTYEVEGEDEEKNAIELSGDQQKSESTYVKMEDGNKQTTTAVV